MVLRTLAALMLLLVPARAAVGARARMVVKLEPVRSAAAKPRLLFPRLPITLGKDRVDGLPKLSPLGRYASVRAGGRDLQFTLDAPTGSHALGILQGKDGKRIIGRAEEANRGLLRQAQRLDQGRD